MITIKLDYTLQSPQERKQYIEELLKTFTYPPTQAELDSMGDYLIMAMDKEERKKRKILTENRLQTINKRETSYEGLAESLESGEDGIYQLARDNKNLLLTPKISITQQDLIDIPELLPIRAEITKLENARKHTTVGRDLYILKKILIDLHKTQYIIKQIFKPPVQCPPSFGAKQPPIHFDDYPYVDKKGIPQAYGVSLLNPTVCSTILLHYSALKEEGWGNFDSDTYYLMEDFDRISAKALEPYPLYERIVELKIDGLQNSEIQAALSYEFQTTYTQEYISSLWRRRIPKLIAQKAAEEYLDWYYLERAKGQYKRCSRCHQIKLAHPYYFSRNKTSKDGYYSICKECRRANRQVKSANAKARGQKVQNFLPQFSKITKEEK